VATVLGRPLGISGYWFRGWRLAEVLDVVAGEWGIRRLGLWPHLVEGIEPAQIRDMLAEHEASAYCLNVPGDLRLNSPGREVEAARGLRGALDLAERLGIPLVQIYAGTDTARNADENVRAYAGALRPWVTEAEARGITIAVENNLDQRGEDPRGVNPSRRPERLRALMEALASPYAGLVYDPCNFYTVGVEPFPAPYELLAPWIVSTEFKDVVPYDQGLHGPRGRRAMLTDTLGGTFLPVPVGHGAVAPGPILGRLHDDHYTGEVVLDPFAAQEDLLSQCRESLPPLIGAADEVLAGHRFP
jgi:sugar phosphate isomerase/epimerase